MTEVKLKEKLKPNNFFFPIADLQTKLTLKCVKFEDFLHLKSVRDLFCQKNR